MNIVPVTFNVEIKTVKKCFAMMDIDIPSDEEIIKGLSSVTIDLSKQEKDTDTQNAVMAFTLMALSNSTLLAEK